jgi:hypothetical protein
MNTHTLTILQDGCAENPRQQFDHLCTIYAEHRRYELSDEKAEDIRLDSGDYPGEYLVLPVYMYEHSGIALNTGGFSCPWDSGQVGYIYVSKDDIKKEFSVKRISKKLKNRIFKIMTSEIEEFSNYLNGNVYGFIYQETTDSGEIISEDSCWGFYGSDPSENGISDHLPVPLAQCEVICQ